VALMVNASSSWVKRVGELTSFIASSSVFGSSGWSGVGPLGLVWRMAPLPPPPPPPPPPKKNLKLVSSVVLILPSAWSAESSMDSRTASDAASILFVWA